MELNHKFRLSFLTDRNAVASFKIPRALINATGQQISDAMHMMIDSGAMGFSEGDPMFSHGAALVTTERRNINIWA